MGWPRGHSEQEIEMRDDNSFDFGWDDEPSDWSADPVNGQRGVEALEQWLVDNYRLWELGLDLAAKARYYRREYEYIPFNDSGWFSPN